MQIIPAIDIFQNSCVRLTGGIFADRTDYRLVPADVAKSFLRDGATYLHVVDLEGAKEGKVLNWKAIEAVAREAGAKMEVGGGIRTEKEIDRLLGFGIDKIVVGSIALQDPELLGRWIARFGSDRICVALDVRDGGIAYAGWREVGNETIGEVATRLIADGIRTFLSTDVARDGRLSGPNIALYSLLVRTFPGIRWLASGGVRTTEDVDALRGTGVAGAVIGKALYEGHLRLDELIRE
jgi:phosphoribosylformimino-5-aminoimidazole carboxamide ribotide isomerase